MASLRDRFARLLKTHQLVTDAQLEEAKAYRQRKLCSLREAVLQLGFAEEREVLAVLGQDLEMPLLDLSRLTPDPELAACVPEHVARRYAVVPVAKTQETLTVAVADPFNVLAIDDLRSVTGLEITPVLSTTQDVQHALKTLYEREAHEAIEQLVADIRVSELEVIEAGPDEDAVEATELLNLNDSPVVRITEQILEQAVRQKASDIMIEPLNKCMRVRVRVDGILQEIDAPPKSIHAAMISRIKVLADLDIAERRVPQDGRFRGHCAGRDIDFRVSIIPSIRGERAVLRLLDSELTSLDLSALGFEARPLEQLTHCALRPYGMILATGPTGSGKTTTLYALLRLLNSPECNIVTVEDPVEYHLPGANQSSMHLEIGYTFARALRAILRQDPEVILVGEIRDGETADISVKAALTGHLVLSTLHTTTAAGAVVRLINMGVEPFLITSALSCVVSQRLVRLLCTECREPHEPPAATLKRLDARPDQVKAATFFRPVGCEACHGLGYRGRSVVAEVLTLTPAIRALVSDQPSESAIKATAREEGMITLRESGLSKAFHGSTSLEEVLQKTGRDNSLSTA